MSTPAEDLVVTHDEAAHRWEGRLDGQVVALADYVPQGLHGDPHRQAIAMVHTEVDPAHENQGLASKVVDAACGTPARGAGRSSRRARSSGCTCGGTPTSTPTSSERCRGRPHRQGTMSPWPALNLDDVPGGPAPTGR